jgi:hypothetical protein
MFHLTLEMTKSERPDCAKVGCCLSAVSFYPPQSETVMPGLVRGIDVS